MAGNLALDGEEIVVGDTPTDLVYGVGTVTEAYDTYVVVQFPDRDVTFNGNGNSTVFNKRTLYWQNPILVTPSKQDVRMDVAASAASAVLQQLRGL